MVITLIQALIVLCIVGLIVWCIRQIPGIPEIVKTVVYVVIGIIVLLWLMRYVGGMDLLRAP